MAKRKVYLGSKNFFTMTVLSVAALFTIFMANSFLQQQTSTQSEATGDNSGSLVNCNIKNNFAGGIEVYDKETGEKRVMCISLNKTTGSSVKNDPHLGKYESSAGKYYNIWNFNDKMDSFKLRANPFCIIEAFIYRDPDYEYLLKNYIIGANSINKLYVSNFDLSSLHKNKASSLKLKAYCAPDKY